MVTAGAGVTALWVVVFLVVGLLLVCVLVGCDELPPWIPQCGHGEVPRAASPNGAVYIPGVGFRYVAPLPRVYGYYAAGPRVYGYSDSREARRYRAYRVSCDRPGAWFGERCARRWR